ncbi:cysteine desulfurase [Caldanaerobius fijiensis DSM 17918]|uniref:Cysteine desulfurase n=1 Tax=Caldanaerobius fijiensis DSM 17918 TaxID=1121256 RepID=A0A1M4WMT8_9THEO|nr:cysteine desulfurase family protein [Caldanaerobius fijiensis]SHE82507.1 cysteine desulfurase [Caldanaerobius fijiensis DSM 17918]
MQVYLDNSATTKPYKEVVEAMIYALNERYENPSSMYRPAMEAEKMIENARLNIAKVIGAKKEEIFFTSGGTEANNTAIKGAAYLLKKRKNHIITTTIEHPSVLNAVMRLEAEGFKVSYIGVDVNGIVDLNEIKDKINDSTALISVMAVNNEIGSIQPIKDIGDIAKEKGVLFHVDAVQGYGKIVLDMRDLNVDLMSISGHKIHGPKGIGAIYIKRGVKIQPLLDGGGQEGNVRSGTENVPGIIGFGVAAEICHKNMDKYSDYMMTLKKRLWYGLKDNISDCFINGPDVEKGAPHILNISFVGVKGEVLLHALEEKGVYVSTGSACSSHKRGVSHVLKNLGLSDDRIESAIRFSLSPFNTCEEVDYTVNVLIDLVREYRKFYRR